jgi:tetratricopeptide (TPR) repeat protein
MVEPSRAIFMLYGASGPVTAWIEHAAATARVAWLGGESVEPPAWHGARQLIAFAADALAEDAFAAVIARHRPIVAALYPERANEPALSDDEHAVRAALAADPRSLHTHSAASRHPLVLAIAALLADAIAATGAIVAVPALAWLDALTARTLIEVFRGHGDRLAGLYVGHDLAAAIAPILVWGQPVTWTAAYVRAQLADFQLAPRVEVVHVSGAGEARWPTGPTNAWSAPTLEAIALAILARSSASADELALCVRAQRWASEVYACSAAFRIGVLLEPFAARLDRAAHAEHAALTAVAATNTHFVDVATPGFDGPLYAMYERALALTRDPIAAAALAVRCAFAGVDRAADDVEPFLARAAASVAAVHAAPWADYFAAWLDIAHAVHALHRHDLVAADRATRAACAALDRAVVAVTAAWPSVHAERLAREAAYARFLVLSHDASAAIGEDDARAARWLAEAEAEAAHGAELARYEVFHWVLIEDQHDWPLHYARCLAGIRDAERDWQAVHACVYRAAAADGAYRLGRLDDAVAHYQRLLTFDTDVNPAVDWLREVRPRALRAFIRAGDRAACLALARRMLTEPGASSSSADVIAHALAMCGERAEAIALLEQAIDAAVDAGEHVAMLRVAIVAAQVMRALADRDELGRALDTAWGLAIEDDGTWAAVTPADARLRLCLLQAHATSATVDLLARACAALPACVADVESGWDIAELLALIAAWRAPDAALPTEIATDLCVLQAHAHARADWQAGLSAIASIRKA